MIVPDTSGNMSVSATALTATSENQYGFVTIQVISIATAGKPVWVMHKPSGAAPTAQEVVDNGMPRTVTGQLLPLFEPAEGGSGVDPSRVFLATANGDGAAEVRWIE